MVYVGLLMWYVVSIDKDYFILDAKMARAIWGSNQRIEEVGSREQTHYDSNEKRPYRCHDAI